MQSICVLRQGTERLHKKEPAEGICGLKSYRERPEVVARGSQPWERSGA
jgi:hypothetical protein